MLSITTPGLNSTKVLVVPPKSFWAKIRTTFTKPLFGIFIQGDKMPVDPVTATMNFLSTPAGQQIATELLKLGQDFVGIIGDLIKKVHTDIAAAQTPKVN